MRYAALETGLTDFLSKPIEMNVQHAAKVYY